MCAEYSCIHLYSAYCESDKNQFYAYLSTFCRLLLRIDGSFCMEDVDITIDSVDILCRSCDFLWKSFNFFLDICHFVNRLNEERGK